MSQAVTVELPAISRSLKRLRGAFRRLRTPSIGLGAIILIFWIVMALAAPMVSPFDPDSGSRSRLQAPSTEHIFGTDLFGRDVFSRVVFGSRLSLSVGILTVIASAIVGTTIGLVSGYFGGLVDTVLMRAVEVMLTFPAILLALLVITILGPGLKNAAIAVGVSAIPQYARLVRGSVIVARENTYVTAAMVQGAKDFRIMVRHILPNISASIIVLATANAGVAMISVAALSFLGLGAQPPTPEWGALLSDGRSYFTTAWWLMTFPGVALMSASFALNLLGDGLREALDPKLRNR
ncbi:MAG: ABC transporter permease [Thermomicrobiales bacterium]|nr:ABC transporter permease [Thermomicrobiales bacterium]